MRVPLRFAASSPYLPSTFQTPAPPRLSSTYLTPASMASHSRDDGEAPCSLLTILSFNLHLLSEHPPHVAFVQAITPHASIVEVTSAASYSFFFLFFKGFFVYMYLCRPSEASTQYCVIPGGYPPQD
jgi:hypothetical protein